MLKPRSEVPAGVPVLRDRWAYDDKLAPGGKSIERFKARLTAMGCFQKEGIDYTDTYASVMCTRTFRMMLQIYNSDPTHRLEHWDVSTAFVHAPLKEQVWMKQATGHEVKGKESWVCLLVKALYGTKQAAFAWQQHLKGLLAKMDLQPVLVDPATYVFHGEGGAFVLIGTHVDDLFVLYNTQGTRIKEKLWEFLQSKLSIKTLGEAAWTLQMSIQRDAKHGVLKLSQEAFTLEVLRRFDATNVTPAPTPAVDAGTEATMTEEDLPKTQAEVEEASRLPVLELIGCLWWLAQITRLDIFVALQRASQWASKPSRKLWRWLMRILKYLAGTTDLGLVYVRDNTAPLLLGYVDAAFADAPNCRSTAGWLILFRGAIVGYDSLVIKRVVTSSTEAECSALTVIGKENTWERRIASALLNLPELGPTPIFGDNTASLSLLSSGVSKRSRYFSIEWFKVKDLVEHGEMKAEWIESAENLADFFTKKLPRDRFVYLRDRLMGPNDRQKHVFPPTSTAVPPAPMAQGKLSVVSGACPTSFPNEANTNFRPEKRSATGAGADSRPENRLAASAEAHPRPENRSGGGAVADSRPENRPTSSQPPLVPIGSERLGQENVPGPRSELIPDRKCRSALSASKHPRPENRSGAGTEADSRPENRPTSSQPPLVPIASERFGQEDVPRPRPELIPDRKNRPAGTSAHPRPERPPGFPGARQLGPPLRGPVEAKSKGEEKPPGSCLVQQQLQQQKQQKAAKSQAAQPHTKTQVPPASAQAPPQCNTRPECSCTCHNQGIKGCLTP